VNEIPTAIEWQDGTLRLLNQALLPDKEEYLLIERIEDVFDAIVTLKVRGAPVIGLAAGFGLALAVNQYKEPLTEAKQQFTAHIQYLASSRPTAVNLFWVLKQIEELAEQVTSVAELQQAVTEKAIYLLQEDEERCKRIGEYALEALGDNRTVMTICNAGTIATAKYGTALAPFHLGSERGIEFNVYSCETRPVFQGARLTAWELQKSNVPVTLITDSMAAHTIDVKGVQAIIVGADRIARNGDTANKIGTRNLAILAQAFNIPFYVAAPTSTIDFTIESGAEIPIEERHAEEITHYRGIQIAPEGTAVFNPAFDVTPARFITGIITEEGVFAPEAVHNININQGVSQ